MNIPFKLGIITDEVSQNIFEAAEFCNKHGLNCMEVRSVNNRSPFDYTEEDINDIITAANRFGLTVCAISSPLFKCNYGDEAAVEYNIESFRKCAENAKRMGAQIIRGFDFWEEGISLEKRALAYGKIAEICEEYDVICALESDPAVHSSTPFLLKDVLAAINNLRIKALFDPGNEIWVTGVMSENAYDVLKPYGIVNVHIKDAVCTDNETEAVKIGTGQADFVTLFKKLIADCYNGPVMLETHYRKNIKLTEDQLKRPGGADFSNGAYEASEESIIALKNIVKKAVKGE